MEMERLQRKRFQGSKCLNQNQNVSRECPEAKHHEGTVIRCSAEGTSRFPLRPCLSISAASLSVYPHTASLIVELLCISVCITEHHPKDATHRWWHRTSPVVSQDFKRRLGDSNAARGRDHKNRSAAVTTAQIRRHCQVVMWSPCRLKNYEDGYPGPL